MTYSPWRRWFTLQSCRMKNPLCKRRNHRPQLESLEGRLAPATHTWTGAVSNLWSNNNNWIGGTPIMDVVADLIFPAGAANLTNSNDLVGLMLQSITYSASGYTTTGNAISFP